MPDPTLRALEARLAGIAHLDMPALQSAWAGRFGRLPPKGLSRRLLELAAAYGAQAGVHGGLKPSVRRKLLRFARTQQDTEVATPLNQAAPRSKIGPLSPGSRLVREWHGRSYSVEVTENGFLYAGRRYRSLSEVARTITGTRWSGPRFFGL